MNKKIKSCLSVASFMTAIIVGIMALWIPPTGIIDSSVLWFTSQCLVFTATMLGVDLNVNYGKGIIKGGNVNNNENDE